MPIVVNGTTIPENVANALNVNGTNITSVVCNGTTVWTQSLFNALWSGSALISNVAVWGLQTSGSSYRSRVNSYYGVWQTVSTSGIFSGSSICNQFGFPTSGNMIKCQSSNVDVAPTWVTFTLQTKSFTGTALATIGDEENGYYQEGLNTSGGLLRFVSSNLSSQYISLT